jgi:hypothetical protein
MIINLRRLPNQSEYDEVSGDKLIFKLDSQIASAIDLCDEKYRMEQIEHWRPLRKAKALERGSICHFMIKHYRRGKQAGRTGMDQHAALVNECILKGEVMAAASFNIDVRTFNDEDKRVFQEYILRWQYDGWEILEVEEPFSKLLFEDEYPIVHARTLYPGLVIIYEGVIDAKVRDPKMGVVVVDTKTESRRSYPYILSNQFQGYEWAFGCPVIVDKVGFQTTLEGEKKFRRLEHLSGDWAIAEWRRDVILKVRKAVGLLDDLANGATSFEKNRTSCDKYSGCIFQKVCKVPEESRAFKLQANFFKDKAWDPYNREDFDDAIIESATESA